MIRLATIVVLSIAVHGLLMSSSAAAPAHPMGVAPAPPDVHATILGSADHGAPCFTGQDAVGTDSHALHVEHATAPRVPLVSRQPPAPGAAGGPPLRPPNVVRALLQVYRI